MGWVSVVSTIAAPSWLWSLERSAVPRLDPGCAGPAYVRRAAQPVGCVARPAETVAMNVTGVGPGWSPDPDGKLAHYLAAPRRVWPSPFWVGDSFFARSCHRIIPCRTFLG